MNGWIDGWIEGIITNKSQIKRIINFRELIFYYLLASRLDFSTCPVFIADKRTGSCVLDIVILLLFHPFLHRTISTVYRTWRIKMTPASFAIVLLS